MAVLIFILSIILIIVGIKQNKKHWSDEGEAYIVLGVIMSVISVALAIYCSYVLLAAQDVDKRISMYEEQNDIIEAQVADAVHMYMEHENIIFDKSSSDSSITLVSLYPELKSDTLIQQQCELYISNNERIVKLKEEKIKAHRVKFLLYFGGIKSDEEVISNSENWYQ